MRDAAPLADDWSTATLDLDAYLRRIGYAGPLSPDEATLTALHRAHQAAVRFENFDIFLRGGVAVDLGSIQDKIVGRGRGGYCYEQGQWVTHYRYEHVKVHPVDVRLSNHYTSPHPDSRFTWQPIVIRRDPDAIRSIVGRSHTVIRAGHVKERRELTDGEFAAALTSEFYLRLTPAEVATLVAVPAAR